MGNNLNDQLGTNLVDKVETDLADKLSAAIDELRETSLSESQRITVEPELDELLHIATGIRQLPHLEYPEPEFASLAAKRIAAQAPNKQVRGLTKWFSPVAVLAASLLVVALLLSTWSPLANKDVVFAAVQTVNKLNNYHGFLEMRTVTADKASWLVRRAEIWSQGEKYAIKDQEGVFTVNNGEQKWQVQPTEKLISILPVLPDPLQASFDLRSEAIKANNYPHKVIGSDMVSGRNTEKVEVSPPGGQVYYLWIDQESKLPVQLQTAMSNSIQTVYTLTNLTINQGISEQIFNYQPNPEYRIVSQDPGRFVSTLEEAATVAGFTPQVPQDSPQRILAAQDKIVLDFSGTLVNERKVSEAMQPAANSALGQADGEVLEVLADSLRWQLNGVEITVSGQRRVELAKQLVSQLVLPDVNNDLSAQAKVKVQVDLEVVKNEQQQVDGGHSPWMIDPLQVAQAYLNSELGNKAPEFSQFKLDTNTGSEAIVSVNSGLVQKLYLKRMLRQDPSGIWSVIGYDPR